MLAGDRITDRLRVGWVLTVATNAAAAGYIARFDGFWQPSKGFTPIAGADVSIGPFAADEHFMVQCDAGEMSYSMAPFDPSLLVTKVAADAAYEAVSVVVELNGAGVPTDGVTGADVAGIGSRYTDITAGKLYVNGGTKAVPLWKIVTSA